MGTCARNRMVRDRFTADQRSCGLRRHLDSVPPDTPIREIVDRCRAWESHSNQKRGSAPGTGLDRGLSGMSGDSRESRLFRPNSLSTVVCPGVDSRIPVSVANVVQSDIVAPRGGGCSQDAPLEIISSLIVRLLRAAQEDNPAEVKVPPDAGARRPSVVPEVGVPGRTPGTWGEQMLPGGHFVSVFTTGLVGGCPRWPIPGGMAWWSSGAVSSGKRGMVRAGESASRIIGDQGRTDPGGGECVSPVGRCRPTWHLPMGHEHGPGWSSSTQAFPPLRSHPAGMHRRDNRGMPVLAQSVLGRRDQVVPDPPIGMGGGSPSVFPQCPELGDLGGGCGLLDGIVGLRGN